MTAKKTTRKTPVLEIDQVWKTYTMGDVEVHALRGLTLQIQKGEFVAIMGPSGSGKSTAMNMIGALDRPSKGTVKVDGINIDTLSEGELAQLRGQKIGFIFQKFNLIPTLTAKENVALPLLFQGIDTQTRDKKATELLKMVGLDERIDHKPTELSGGQQQRVAIARALVTDPEVVLADEPTGNLDSKSGETVMDFLKGLHKHGRTVVMVTHDEETARNADRIEVLRDGQIIGERK